jgi:succinate dehydrogenase / fumarate reductase cytochrome b subunit
VSLSDALFLTAMSLLVVLLASFSVLVAWSGLNRASGPLVRVPGVRATLRALELSAGSEAAAGRWAFYVHRLTGVGVLGFLGLHVVDVSLFAFSTRLYDHVHRLYETTGLRILECGLMFAVLFHALNGIRLLVVDGLNLGPRAAKRSLIPVVAVSVGAGIAASAVILSPVL